MDAELACFVHGVLDKLPSGSAADTLANAAAAPPAATAAAAPAAAAEASAAQLQGTPWSEVEKKIAAMDSEGGSVLGAEETAAIETYGQNALVGRELELFGRRPLDQPLLVSVCKQCSRPILTAHFAAHRENHAGQNPLVAASSNRKEVALLSLTPADLALASRKHDGSSWRPPPRQVIMNIADEVNSRPLDTISFATINQAD